jgi:hypothetical protein
MGGCWKNSNNTINYYQVDAKNAGVYIKVVKKIAYE